MALSDVIGQDRAKRILQGMLKKGRLPHALLFTGEPGVGKLLTAKNLLKALNCKNRSLTSATKQEELDACDSCRTCHLIDTFNFADLLYINLEGEQIKIETVREINEFLSKSPYEAEMKMVIVNQAEKLNISAANAFLKTLEEPPSDSLIILISERADLLPDTIRSRCVSIYFRPLNTLETTEVIKRKTGKDIASKLPLLFTGMPGLMAEDGFDEYLEAIKLLRNFTVTAATKKEPSKNELLKIMDIALAYLRDLLVEHIESSSNIFLLKEKTTTTSLPTMMAKVTVHEQNSVNMPPTGLHSSEQASAQAEAHVGVETRHHSGIPQDIQVIIESYKKIFLLKQEMQFNLNLKITWNYLITILEDLAPKK